MSLHEIDKSIPLIDSKLIQIFSSVEIIRVIGISSHESNEFVPSRIVTRERYEP